jgi:hypothetical protein
MNASKSTRARNRQHESIARPVKYEREPLHHLGFRLSAGLAGKASQPVRSVRGPGSGPRAGYGEREASKAEQDRARTIKPFVASDHI